ncbi:leucine-rich repeat domain-containing protein [Nannocystis radixulma]|uniref:Leucine-rich repeat domain-containing protein n=1 Tax=Nannocystis radixulma TaxID=2995305 RepID=A0ABT5B7D7_9BACT|nr:hypothetical protein [Nannocystis radixulma]MDC0670024.1 hypothetical protein [Nannocystis radixulma]
MHVVDLSLSSLELAVLRDLPALELQAEGVEPEALAAALAVLRDARGLKALRLRSRVRALPLALTELRGLQQLELIDHELPGLPAAISELTRLRSLRLELFHLASLPRSLAGLTRLRELYLDSHHLSRLPENLGALAELRSLTLLLRHLYLHDWERPAHFRPRFEQPLADLCRILGQLPQLSSLTLGEPDIASYPDVVFDRLPPEFAGLHALEHLTFTSLPHRVALPHGVVMPGVRQIDANPRRFDATEAELLAMFPNAQIDDS